ncbi:MAG: VCBS repeat-containing protein, partial [Acidobacteria bacterium]|nr:VCBS repeat-containing protein [Acidobacteriota bacterium]
MILRYSFKLFHRFLSLLVITIPTLAVGQAVAAPFTFNLAPRYLTGLNAVQTAYSDLDGDGFQDVITVNGGQANPSPSLNLAFGTGGGGFEEPLVLPSYLIGHTVAAGDLNNDGRPDLVIAGWYHNRIAVFLNQGNRQFASPWFTAPPDPPYGGNPNATVGEFFDLAIADFDGDGNNDVVALQDQVDQRLRFFHFSGQGALTVFATINQLETGTSYEREIEVGDLNGDNRLDIVFAGGGPFGVRNISFVFGQPAGGTLSLTWGFGVEDKAVGISIKDLDNDGDGDMAVAFEDVTTPTRHSLQVFRNNGGADFVSLPKIFLEYPFPATDITTDDFNHDGKPDIGGLISGSMVLVLIGIGDGTFVEQAYYATSSSASIFSTDLDRDGKIDILTASRFVDQTDYVAGNAVSILFNDGFHGFRAPLVTLWGPNFIDAGDFNSDGYKDLVSSWATSFSTSGVDILINDTVSGFLLPELHHPSPAWLNGMKTGDFNGDGKSDAVSIHRDNTRGLASYLGNGNGSIAAPVFTQFTRGLVNIIVGKFNSDGRDDVFVIDELGQGYSMLSNGNGTFSVAPGSPVTFPSNVPYEPQKGDFNSDGRLDLVITMNATVELWLGDGAGRFVKSPVTLPAMIRTAPGDWNGDGKLDLAGMANDGILGVLGDGHGGFGAGFYKPIEGTYSISLTSSIVSEDFDRDGSDEVVLLMSDNYNGNLIVMQYGGSNITASWKQPVFYDIGPASRTWGGMLVATDFNTDGKPDLGYLGTNARGVIYNTTGTQTSGTQFDYDGDGKSDLSVRRPTDNIWYLLQSTAGFTGITWGVVGDRMAPADYDGDGRTDVAVFRPSTGQWFVVNSSNLTFTTYSWGQDGDLPVPTDRDNDGRADLVLFRPSTSTWYPRSTATGPLTPTQFGAAGDKPMVGDFDADGIGDTAVYRPS